MIVISLTTTHIAFALLPTGMVYGHTTVVFPFESYSAFCALQCRLHEVWARFLGSTLGDGLRYTRSDVFETFPFPAPAPPRFASDAPRHSADASGHPAEAWHWTTHPALEAAGRAYYGFRADLMVMNNEGLTKTYNRFHDPHERAPDIAELRRLHAVMDRAVLDAYGWGDIATGCDFIPEHADEDDSSGRRKRRYRYRWPDSVRDDVLGRLMELNGVRATEEAKDER